MTKNNQTSKPPQQQTKTTKHQKFCKVSPNTFSLGRNVFWTEPDNITTGNLSVFKIHRATPWILFSMAGVHINRPISP